MRRMLGLGLVILGILGMAGCMAGAYGVWLVWRHLDRANERVFEVIDRGLGAVEDQLPLVQRQARAAKITTSEILDTVQALAAKKVRDRVAAEWEVKRRVETLSGHLQAADTRLEGTECTVRDVRRVMELGQSLGIRFDPISTDSALELLAALRGELREASQTVEEVRQFVFPAPGETVQDRLARIAKVLVRVMLTLSDVDRRIERIATQLSEVRATAPQVKERVSRYILWGSIAGYGLLAWIAAGQAALARSDWRRLP